MKIIFMLGIFMLTPSCQTSISTMISSQQEDWDEKREMFLDTPKNRNFFTNNYERMMVSESNGNPPAPNYKDWNDFWKAIFRSLRSGGQENPEFYINYIKARRKELGLPQ